MSSCVKGKNKQCEKKEMQTNFGIPDFLRCLGGISYISTFFFPKIASDTQHGGQLELKENFAEKGQKKKLSEDTLNREHNVKDYDQEQQNKCQEAYRKCGMNQQEYTKGMDMHKKDVGREDNHLHQKCSHGNAQENK